jgi:hypothetical protein
VEPAGRQGPADTATASAETAAGIRGYRLVAPVAKRAVEAAEGHAGEPAQTTVGIEAHSPPAEARSPPTEALNSEEAAEPDHPAGREQEDVLKTQGLQPTVAVAQPWWAFPKLSRRRTCSQWRSCV